MIYPFASPIQTTAKNTLVAAAAITYAAFEYFLKTLLRRENVAFSTLLFGSITSFIF